MVTNVIVARNSAGAGASDSGKALSSLPGGTGLSAGDNPMGLGVWAMGGGMYLNHAKFGANYRGGLRLATVGVDKQFGSLLLGVGFGNENLDLTTHYNNGSIVYDGFSVIPYLSYAITQDLVADASLIYAWLSYTVRDQVNVLQDRDYTDAYRRVVSAGLTKYLTFNKLLLSGRLGTMYMNEHQDLYHLNGNRYGDSGVYNWQGMANLRGTYDLGAFKPFVGATFSTDLVKSGKSSIDTWGSDFDLGFSYNLTDSFQFGLTGTYGLREYMTKAGGMLNVRYDF